MTKTYKIIGVDCANCAAKTEARILKIKGVNDCSISYMTQKLYLEADDERFESVLQEVLRVIKKYEPDYKVIL
ncbi:MAG: cation transporter [Clostridia bacterium]|nr:cation transporter [Clostridia bacterium]